VDAETLVLSVQDDGPGIDLASTDVAGVGLANTRERLATLFGGAASLELRRAERGGTIATIRLPLRRRVRA
jgi:sensor histidine kinase YesM